MAMARAGGGRRSAPSMLEGWFAQKIPVVSIPGADDPEQFVLVHGHFDSWEVGVGDNATGDATPAGAGAGVVDSIAAGLRRSVKIAWWPGHSTGRYAGVDLVRRRVRPRSRPELPGADQLRQPGLPLGDQLSRYPRVYRERGDRDGSRSATSCRAPRSRRIGRRRRAITASTISACRASSCSARRCRRRCGKEKDYYDVSGCGANIAWHTENDTIEIADRDMLLTDMKIYLLSVLRVVNAGGAAVRLGGDLRRVPRDDRALRECGGRAGRSRRRRGRRPSG